MTATPEQLAFLQAINADVNALPYLAAGSDVHQGQLDRHPGAGEGLAMPRLLERKAMLMREQGWDHLEMGEVLCNTEVFADPSMPPGTPPARYYHSVEFARAGGEVWILDNRYPDIYPALKPPYDYQWIHQQVAGTLNWRDASGGLT